MVGSLDVAQYRGLLGAHVLLMLMLNKYQVLDKYLLYALIGDKNR